MASRGKKKTTIAKLNREAKLRERRVIKEANKQERARLRLEPPADAESAEADPDVAEPAVASLDSAPADA
jgi:hypothetical protein